MSLNNRFVVRALFGSAFLVALALPNLSAQPSSNVPSQAGALRVNTPKANETLAQTFVHVTYQLVNRGASPASSPNFTVQLDGNDPVNTTAYEYTFTGLAAGTHTITVTLVDANGVPIANSSVSTKFVVKDGTRNPSSAPTALHHRRTRLRLAKSQAASLPIGSTPLPILSLVGFGVLVGGIWTAIQNR
jgi:hypothetical protein